MSEEFYRQVHCRQGLIEVVAVILAFASGALFGQAIALAGYIWGG